MIGFLTEILELVVASVAIASALPLFKKNAVDYCWTTTPLLFPVKSIPMCPTTGKEG